MHLEAYVAKVIFFDESKVIAAFTNPIVPIETISSYSEEFGVTPQFLY